MAIARTDASAAATLGLGLFSAAAALVAFHLTAAYADADSRDGPRDATFAGAATFFAVFSAVRLLVPIIMPARSPFPVESSRSAMDLSLARILFLLMYAQNVSFRRLPKALTAGSHSVKTGLWGDLATWRTEWVDAAWWEPHAIPLLVAFAMAGGTWTQPCFFCLAILEVRAHVLMQTNTPLYFGHHSGHLFAPILLVFAFAPSGDALKWSHLLRPQTRPSLASLRVNRPEYTIPFTALLLIIANAYLSAAIPKLIDCGARSTYTCPFSDTFWSTDLMADIIRTEYFKKCDGYACLDPRAVRWRPLCLDTLGAYVAWAWSSVFGDGSVPRPGVHAACLLGDSYLNPALRFDQLPPIMLRAAALSAVIWEAGMWLCVLLKGPPRWLSVCTAFLFHQGNLWMANIRFYDFADMYIVWMPWGAILGLILRGRTEASADPDDCEQRTGMLAGEEASDQASLEADSGRPQRCSSMASSRGKRSQLLVVIFSIVWGTLRLRPGIAESGSYPLARFPEFCRANYPDKVAREGSPFLREVRLLAASATTPREFALLARVPLYKRVGKFPAREGSPSRVHPDREDVCEESHMESAVGHLLHELPSLGLANWTAVTHAQFVIMRFALDSNSSLRSQLERSKNVRLVILVDLNLEKFHYSHLPPLQPAYPSTFAADSGVLLPPAAADSPAWVRACPREKKTHWRMCSVRKGPDPAKPAKVKLQKVSNSLPSRVWHVCAPPCGRTCSMTI